MSNLLVPQVPSGLTIEEYAEIIARALKEIDWAFNGNISDQNISRIANFLASATEFKHISGLVGMSGFDPANPLAVRFWAGHADKTKAPYRVLQNGYMYSTHGFIGGWDIGTDKLSGTGTIEGGTIIGSEIMTALAGVYPRASMSSIDDLFSAEQSATEFIRMAANYLGSVALLINSSTVSGVIGPSVNDLLITTFFGEGNVQISAGQDLLLYSSGQTIIDSWAKLYSHDDNQTLQQALNDKQSAITSGDITIIGNTATLNAGISATKISSGLVDNAEYDALNGVTSAIQPQLNGKASKTLPSWTTATLQNSWGNYGGAQTTAAYYKDDLSIVRIKGLINNGTTTPGTLLFTLPTGSRPSENLVKTVGTFDGTNLKLINLDILTDGSVKIGSIAALSAWINLDDIVPFRV